jgi:Nuclease-related domain
MRAGKNIRNLAWRRRVEAIQVWAVALLLAILPILLWGSLPVWTYGVCWTLTIGLGWQGRSLWRRAGHADQGATAEETIASILAPLKPQGWQIEYGVRHPAVGDVDVVLRSPKGRTYTIDVKSHKGTVGHTHDALYRQYGPSRYAFEKDFLKQAKHQAVVIQKSQQVRFVTPLLVFANATVEISNNPVAGVYILSKDKLIQCLERLG